MKKNILFIVILVLGVVLTAWLTPQAFRVHYHANMAVVIDGQKWDFSLEKYMEEVERCNVTSDVRPQDRTHLHDKNGDTVHVHMAASTWGDLFANIGWNVTNVALTDESGKEYRNTEKKRVLYILNGEELLISPTNTPIASEDRLLVYYGTGTFEEILIEHYPLVSRNAIEYNNKQDPASCSQNANAPLLDGVSSVVENIKEKLPHSHTMETAH